MLLLLVSMLLTDILRLVSGRRRIETDFVEFHTCLLLFFLVLDALLSAVDSNEEAVSLEAMNALAKVFELVDESRVSPVLVNLCNRVRPSMEADNPKMRAASFNLFGTLWHFGQKVRKRRKKEKDSLSFVSFCFAGRKGDLLQSDPCKPSVAAFAFERRIG